MAGSENIKVMNQAAVQMAMVVMMALWDTETGPWSTTEVSHSESQIQGHSVPILTKPTFSKTLKHMNSLRRKISSDKKLVGPREPTAYINFYTNSNHSII